ncbi:MAG TPA: VTT domain-containing protein [Stellaceae bacterium]|nr:VTT domain-containing protein [Stellaceae bacterium]
MRQRIRWLAPRLFAAIVILVAIAAMWHEREWFDPTFIEGLLKNHPWAPAAFVAVHVVFSLIFIPRTVLAIAGGLVFGLWWGLVWSTVGAMAGALAGFGLVRALGRERLGFLHLPQLTPFLGRIERGGWRAVWAIRLPPLPHTPVNYAFGLTGISWGAYTFGTFLGILPSTAFAVAVGAAGSKAIQGDAWILPTAIGAAGFAISMLLPRLIRPGKD